jgi:hypothetical protein
MKSEQKTNVSKPVRLKPEEKKIKTKNIKLQFQNMKRKKSEQIKTKIWKPFAKQNLFQPGDQSQK